jgi:hypothetical protein
MRVLVTGGRKYDDKATVFSTLAAVHAKHGVTVVIHGGARGADALSAEWARLRKIPCEVFEADWDKHKKAAGILRNIEMLRDGKPDCCIAFPGGKGTAHMLGLMRKSGLPLLVIE